MTRGLCGGTRLGACFLKTRTRFSLLNGVCYKGYVYLCMYVFVCVAWV